MSNKPENNIILVTFDHHRVEYQTMSYSVASILATLKHYNIPAAHYSFDIRNFKKTHDGYMPLEVLFDLDSIVSYLKKFSCIAIGVTRWSETFAYMLIRKLEDYKGRIVVGGYEITAMKQNHFIADLLKIQHFIKGYAEKPLVKLMQGQYPDDQKFITEKLDPEYLFSPYIEQVLHTYSRKIYWETKRGCTFKCGFCEWGNTNLGKQDLSLEEINKDIQLFSKSTIDEINILDGTFNVGQNYLDILKKLINNTSSKITFQARFESLTPEFLNYCALNKERLHLEFGLQTIHQSEMELIGRKNKIKLIKKRLQDLHKLGIDYEVSIIYAIPGQTIASFVETIDFLRKYKCTKIMAYPLQIPENSSLQEKIKENNITFRQDEFYVKSVGSSNTFTSEERTLMDQIASLVANDPDGFDCKRKQGMFSI
jgi:radical SAM superfamily enzyme YgiQ (UPF0313 family)